VCACFRASCDRLDEKILRRDCGRISAIDVQISSEHKCNNYIRSKKQLVFIPLEDMFWSAHFMDVSIVGRKFWKLIS